VWRENLTVTLPDGDLLIARNFGRNTMGAEVSASLSRYRIVEPGRQVQLDFDGPAARHTFEQLVSAASTGGQTSRLTLDLTFTASAPLWDMHAGHGTDATGIAGAMHIEQLGLCDGHLSVNGNRLSIAAAQSCRDHSRGARNIAPYRNHCWINGSFPGGRSFQLYVFRIRNVAGNALSLAVITDQGQQYPATVEAISFVDSAADIAQLQTLTLCSALGDMQIRVTAVQATIPISMTAPFNPTIGVVAGPHGLIYDEPIRIEWNGLTGYGWSERGFAREPLG
jgi:hypothetical protein